MKNLAGFVILALLGLPLAGCNTLSRNSLDMVEVEGWQSQPLTPRMDLFLASEINRGGRELPKTLGYFWDRTSKDADAFGENLTVNGPAFLAGEFTKRPAGMGKTLNTYGHAEMTRIRTFPANLIDSLSWILGF